nr:MAG TPA: hypothetical protein [Caudoviricetes sp.]
MNQGVALRGGWPPPNSKQGFTVRAALVSGSVPRQPEERLERRSSLRELEEQVR